MFFQFTCDPPCWSPLWFQENDNIVHILDENLLHLLWFYFTRYPFLDTPRQAVKIPLIHCTIRYILTERLKNRRIFSYLDPVAGEDNTWVFVLVGGIMFCVVVIVIAVTVYKGYPEWKGGFGFLVIVSFWPKRRSCLCWIVCVFTINKILFLINKSSWEWKNLYHSITNCVFHSVKQIKARMYYGEYKAPTRWKPAFPLGITMTRTLRPVTFRAEPPRAPDRMPQPPWVEGANAIPRRPIILLRHPSARKKQRVSGYYATPMI